MTQSEQQPISGEQSPGRDNEPATYLPPTPDPDGGMPPVANLQFSSLSNKGFHGLHLIPVDDDAPAIPLQTVLEQQGDPNTLQSTQEAVRQFPEWYACSEAEHEQLIAHYYQIWNRLTLYQRNALIVDLIGWHPDQGPIPYWSTNINLAVNLKIRAGEDIFSRSHFAEILYLQVSQKCGFAPVPETGVALLDPQMRADHYLTLSTAESADDICFAFVLTNAPDAFTMRVLHPEPVTGPVPAFAPIPQSDPEPLAVSS